MISYWMWLQKPLNIRKKNSMPLWDCQEKHMHEKVLVLIRGKVLVVSEKYCFASEKNGFSEEST